MVVRVHVFSPRQDNQNIVNPQNTWTLLIVVMTWEQHVHSKLKSQASDRVPLVLPENLQAKTSVTEAVNNSLYPLYD